MSWEKGFQDSRIARSLHFVPRIQVFVYRDFINAFSIYSFNANKIENRCHTDLKKRAPFSKALFIFFFLGAGNFFIRNQGKRKMLL